MNYEMRKNKPSHIGEIFWLKTESDISHPHVVIEINSDTATVCTITTNKKKFNLPGNVILNPTEGNLEKESIVDVAKVFTVSIDLVGSPIGMLDEKRVKEIIQGISFLKRTFFSRSRK
jgi:mRNA interferase MazF